MRLPPFSYRAPRTVDEAVSMLSDAGPTGAVLAGGTDLFPNMKRRHQTPKTLVALRGVRALAGARRDPDGTWRLGPATTLRDLERDRRLAAEQPALATAVRSISTPLLRTTGTIGGNVLLDTRCNYYDQNYEWRRAIDFCMKCDGDTCWVAPSSDRCWAVQSSDSAPVFCALGATATFASPRGTRSVALEDLYLDDGIRFLAKEPDEVLTELVVPPPDGVRSHYGKLRRRGSFDFPVLGVATAVRLDGDRVASARLFLVGVGSAPTRCVESEAFLVGKRLDDEVVRAAADLAKKPAKPLDNTDFESAYRRKMVAVWVRRGLEAVRPGAPATA